METDIDSVAVAEKNEGTRKRKRGRNKRQRQKELRADHKIWRVWKYLTLLDGWKKTPIYIFMGLVTLYKPYKLWLVYLAGGFAICLGALHLMVSIFQKVLKSRRKKKEHRYGHSDLDSLESSKFEEVTEVLDDCMPEPMPGSSVSLSDSLHTEQDTILEI